MEVNWLEQFVKYRGLSREFWEFIDREGIDRQKIDEQLRQYGLGDFIGRSQFLWKLQGAVEKIVVDYPHEQNNDVADLVVKWWNHMGLQPPVDKFVVRAMIDRMIIRHDMMKKAFQSLCSGHFPSYELYAQGDYRLFVELLVRFGLLFIKRSNELFSLAEAALPLLIKGISPKEEVMKVLDSLMMIKKDRTIYIKGMQKYKDTFSPNELVFTQGMLNILIPVLKEVSGHDTTAFLLNVRTKMRDFFADEELTVEVQREEEKPYEECGFRGQQDGQGMEGRERNEKETVIISSPTRQEVIQSLIDQVDIWAASMKEHLWNVTQQLSPASQPTDVHLLRELEQLREENARLYMELEQMKRQQTEVEWRRFKQFIQAVGGTQNHYLLSELYEDIYGIYPKNYEMIKGRLVNLFNALSLFGLEPTTYGYEIGEEIVLSRQDLRERFMMLRPIVSLTNEVRVKIVRYGWMIYGQVIVQPLVEEVIEFSVEGRGRQ